MTAARTLEAWKEFCRSQKAGGDNVFGLGGASYSFDARPRELKGGALRGRLYKQERGGTSQDIGYYQIARDGSIDELPEELRVVLKVAQPEPEPRPDDSSDIDDLPLYEGERAPHYRIPNGGTNG